MKFSIWAPKASQLELCLGDRRLPMRKTTGEYWETDANVPPEGLRYRYAIDGGAPVPDPGSRWQPDGVHGDSWASAPAPPPPRLERFTPLAQAVIYELHVGTFTPEGTYAGVARRLPHLVDLGVTHLELMPLATFPGRHGWGYDGTFWFAPHPAYGTPAELAALVAACHAHGLAVLLDVVYNHFGPDGNYWPQFGPCFSPNRTLWGEALNFDGPDSDGLRQLVLENATMWLRDYGFDGLRLDAVHAISDHRARHILEELSAHVRDLERQLDRPLVLLAESDLNNPRLVQPATRGGCGLDAFWADDFHHAVHRFLTGETQGYYADFDGLADIARALRDGYVYQGQYAPSRRRGHGRPPAGLMPSQFVFCIQNHDQVGNRGKGERLAMLLPPEKLKAAAALLLLAPQVPLLFQGEEWGARTPFLYFTDHLDPKLGQAVSEGRRREFPGETGIADPQALETFLRSRLNWDELSGPGHAELLGWYRQLLALRRTLAGAPCDVRCDAAGGWLAMDRGSVFAAWNFSDQARELPRPRGDWQPAMSSRPSGDGAAVPAGATVILRKAG